MGARGQSELQGWTPEPTYPKPDISVRATTLYYEIIAPLMLPYVKGRLLNLFRCRQEKCFFQRSRAHPPSGRDFKEPVRFEPVEQKNGRTEDYLYVTDVEGIVACAKVQTVEFHGWGSCTGGIETPDRIVIDLDPGEGVEFEQVQEAAMQLRRSFEAVDLEPFALLTGSKGIHVVVPIQPEATWPVVRNFAKAFCIALADADPQQFTIALQKRHRHGRIFLDYLRNQRTATAILPFSARARDGAPVAAPIAWDELEKFVSPTPFTVADAAELLRRAKRKSLANWGFAEQRLPRFA
jgi:bifunctional non-homologous end joining protein LigD